MKKITEEAVNTQSAAEIHQQEETWRKSIAAQVFLNYFIAINYHIQHSEEAGLQDLPFFQEFGAALAEQDREALEKMLIRSWSTEYALRSTAELGGDDYLRHALHWTFPQAYYSIFAGLQAFLYILKVKTNNPEIMSSKAGRLVARQAYPRAIGYYAGGTYPDFSMHRLPFSRHRPGLQMPEQEREAQAQIGQFLRTTRRLKALEVRRQLQSNAQTALRSTKTGKVLNKWSSEQWQQITWRLGYTTLFDLLGRLRISSTHKEIDRFVEAAIDFKRFHESLLGIVSYLNGLHETYVAKAVGLERYQALVQALPSHLQGGFVTERLKNRIEPLLGSSSAEQLHSAA